MSPYRRGRVWWGRLKAEDGTLSRVSLKTHDRQTAERLERMLGTLADQHRWLTLDAIRSGELPLAEAFTSYARGDLAALEQALADGTRAVDVAALVPLWAADMARKGRPSAPQQKKYLMQVRRVLPPDRPFAAKDFTARVLAERVHALGVGQPNRYFAALSRFARFLVHRGIVPANPVRDIERSAERDPIVYELPPEDVTRLLFALPEQDRPWHALMAATGAEWSAIANARRADLDADALTFRARGTKTASRDRVVLIRKDGPEVGILRGYVRRMMLTPDARLFPHLGSHRAALARLQRVAHDLGLPRMRIHDWRHVYATQAIRDGRPLWAIAHQLGHGNTLMVQKVYGRFRVTLDDLRAVEHPDKPISGTLTTSKEA